MQSAPTAPDGKAPAVRHGPGNPRSLLEQLPEIVRIGKRRAEQILEGLDGRSRIVASLVPLLLALPASAAFTFSGASIGFGVGLDPLLRRIPAGGEAGNFVDLFSQTAPGAARGPYLNDSQGGVGTASALSRYDALPHAASPVVTGSTSAPAYYATGFDLLFNDAGFLHTPNSETLRNLSTTATKARADGYLFVLLTCPFVSNATDPAAAAAQNANIASLNAAILAHAVPTDIIIDTAGWVPAGAQTDPALWQADGIHPTLAGQAILAGKLAAFFKTPEPTMTPSLVNGVLQGDYEQPANRPDLRYTVLGSASITGFTADGVTVIASQSTPTGMRLTVRAAAGQNFLRLRVQ